MRTMAGYELTGHLKKLGLRGHAIEFDEDMVFPSPAHIAGPITDYFHSELKRKGLLIPHAQSNDCEDFAIRMMMDAREWHHKTHPGTGLAFGVLLYRIGGMGGKAHWANWGVEWLKVKPVELRLFFYQALTRKLAPLTEAEINTCEYQLS